MAVMTLETLAEQIILLESGGDQSRDSELEMEDVILLIKQSAAHIIQTMMALKFSSGGDFAPEHHFIHGFSEQTVAKDSGTGLHYITLPSVPFALPENRGVHEVYPGHNYDNPYGIIPMGAVGGFADAMRGEIFCAIEKDKVWFYNMKEKVPKVTVKLILVNPESLDKADQLYLPYEHQKLVIEEVRKLLATQGAADQANDSVDRRSST